MYPILNIFSAKYRLYYLFRDVLLLDTVGGGVLFIPMIAAQWIFEPEKLDFLGMKIPGFHQQSRLT